MAALSDPFRHWLPPTERDKVAAVTNGLVVLDTNVLLDAYRFAPRARNELFEALEKLGDRLWIPHQVALEFHKNRAAVIAEHDATYRETLTAISDFRNQVREQLGSKIRELAKRVALSDDEASQLQSLVVHGLDQAISELGHLKDRHGISDEAIYLDPVLERFQRLLLDKVGAALSEEDESSARKEAQRRIDQKVPPGYADRRKADPCGDYLVWVQALREAGDRKVPLLIVTRDVKDDWFWRSAGKTIGARSELVEECQKVAGVPFVLMTTHTFLNYATTHLSARVSDDTLRQVDSLPPPHNKEPGRLTGKKLHELVNMAVTLIDSLDRDILRFESRLDELHGLLFDEETDSDAITRVQKMIDREKSKLSRAKKLRLDYLFVADELQRSGDRGTGARVKVSRAEISRLVDEYDFYVRAEQSLIGE
ncbi:PIN domain-containing protein [Micromonospora profundi]|uniref:PIN domain-containing protein n=1 Tax=Micromonospora profundi TaxID=1420889 RepID=UPI0038153A58